MRLILRNITRTLRSATRIFELHIPCFEAKQGEILALVGESGSGKTAMLELLALAAVPDPGGQFMLEGARPVDVAGLWRRRELGALAATRAARLGFVAQSGGLLPFLTARANAALAQEVAGRPDAQRIARLAERLDVVAVLDELPARLSLGQRQRVAILRALAHRPDFVIADEPTSALDPRAGRDAIGLFLAVAAEEGAGVILSSHNIALMKWAGVETVEVVPGDLRERGSDATGPTDRADADENASRAPEAEAPHAGLGSDGGGSTPSPRPVGAPSRSDAPSRWVSRVERAL